MDVVVNILLPMQFTIFWIKFLMLYIILNTLWGCSLIFQKPLIQLTMTSYCITYPILASEEYLWSSLEVLFLIDSNMSPLLASIHLAVNGNKKVKNYAEFERPSVKINARFSTERAR